MTENRMTPELVGEMAKRYHEMLNDEIIHPGDVIMVVSLMFTSMLALEIASSGSAGLVDHLLDTIKSDARIIAGRIAAGTPVEEPVTIQ